jgi:hypothetical protein
MPYSGLALQAGLSRGDFVVLDNVEAASTTTSILGGVIQVIDSDNWKVFGIPFFTEKYTTVAGGPLFDERPEQRAYYKALEKTPDADTVLVKSMDREETGVPGLYSTTSVRFRGKAIRLKPDR